MELLKCPNCKSDMREVKEPDITFYRCKECGGVFLDKGELNILATGMAGNIELCSIDDESHKDKFGIRYCPKCTGQKMKKVNLLVYSEIVFDFCPKCEGFYLDKGEINKMNIELEELNKDKHPQEYRGYIDNHLVRLDKIKDVAIGGMGAITYPQNIFFLRLSVYFEKPFNIGLRVHSEKRMDKISKLIGLFKQQDIQTEDKALDSAFIIQGKDEQKVKALLSSEELKKELLTFVSNKPKMLTAEGKLEITDKRIVLTEGPYDGPGSYDAEKDPSGVVKRALKLALLFEESGENI